MARFLAHPFLYAQVEHLLKTKSKCAIVNKIKLVDDDDDLFKMSDGCFTLSIPYATSRVTCVVMVTIPQEERDSFVDFIFPDLPGFFIDLKTLESWSAVMETALYDVVETGRKKLVKYHNKNMGLELNKGLSKCGVFGKVESKMAEEGENKSRVYSLVEINLGEDFGGVAVAAQANVTYDVSTEFVMDTVSEIASGIRVTLSEELEGIVGRGICRMARDEGIADYIGRLRDQLMTHVAKAAAEIAKRQSFMAELYARFGSAVFRIDLDSFLEAAITGPRFFRFT
jgi:hypothetical protein